MLALAFIQVGPLPKHPSQVSLVSEARQVRPGTSFEVALRFQMMPGWHIYWQNPGDAGQAPSVTWNLPKGWKAGPIQWPTPIRLDTAGVVTYTYSKEALLLTKISVPTGAQSGRFDLIGSVDWLTCREGCIPDKLTVKTSLTVGLKSIADPFWKPKLEDVASHLPISPNLMSATAQRTNDTITLTVGINGGNWGPMFPGMVQFFSQDSLIDPSAPQPTTGNSSGRELKLRVSPYATGKSERLRGILVVSSQGALPEFFRSYVIDIPIQRTKP